VVEGKKVLQLLSDKLRARCNEWTAAVREIFLSHRRLFEMHNLSIGAIQLIQRNQVNAVGFMQEEKCFLHWIMPYTKDDT